MKRTSLPKRFQTLLAEIPYATIATASADAKPWNSPVVGYFDNDMNLYWSSWVRSRHSINIAHNNAVFVVVYDTHSPLGTGVALYIQMRANKLSKQAEIEAARLIYLDRYGEDRCKEPFAGKCPRRIYRAEPQKMWTNTDGVCKKHFIDVRLPLDFTANNAIVAT